MSSVPVARLRALVRLLGPGELTPTAKRQILLLCDEYDELVALIRQEPEVVAAELEGMGYTVTPPSTVPE